MMSLREVSMILCSIFIFFIAVAVYGFQIL